MHVGVSVGATGLLVARPGGAGLNPAQFGSVERDLRAYRDVTYDGSNLVSAWGDLGPNGKHCPAAPSNQRVTYLATDPAVGGKPALVFTSTAAPNSKYLPFAAWSAALTPAGGDVFVVMASGEDVPTPPGQDGGIISRDIGGDVTQRDYHPFTDGGLYNGWGSTARKTCGRGSIPAGALLVPHVVHVRSRPNDWRIMVNNTVVFSTATNTVAWGASPVFGDVGLRTFFKLYAKTVFFPGSDENGYRAALAADWSIAL